MIALGFVCGLLAILLAIVLIKFLRLKNDIRQLSLRLDEIINSDTNAKLTTQTFDKDITAFIQSVNNLLTKNRRDFMTTQRTEEDLKRAIINISHDLRTPLTSAMGYLQMMKGDSRYLEIIKGRLDTLASLMDNLFAFSQAMEEKVSVKRSNIGNILREALTGSYIELEAKGFIVEAHIPDSPEYCLCDEDALKRVLQNLVKNAYVHGKEYLRVGLTGNRIEIINKADGLQDLEISRIFDRFYTADAARTHKRTGLGLAIAKELTEKMGGQIFAYIENEMLIVRVDLQK
ncbi:MAG: HAMP domain-containing histidine kinase [Defluviitaleaceae bacterium]|nr:HAMP domain-containing histidine kinase [Defluviitaleaceae bacterium]